MTSDTDIYTAYYLRQAGCGYSNIYSAPAFQRGTGVGSFLSGLFRAVFPIVKKSTSALGQELLRSSAGVLNDVWTKGDLKAAQKHRGKEFISNVSNRVTDHMFGSGYNNLHTTAGVQSKKRAKPRKTRKTTKPKRGGKKKTASKKKKVTKKKKTVPKKNRTKQDIFS